MKDRAHRARCIVKFFILRRMARRAPTRIINVKYRGQNSGKQKGAGVNKPSRSWFPSGPRCRVEDFLEKRRRRQKRSIEIAHAVFGTFCRQPEVDQTRFEARTGRGNLPFIVLVAASGSWLEILEIWFFFFLDKPQTFVTICLSDVCVGKLLVILVYWFIVKGWITRLTYHYAILEQKRTTCFSIFQFQRVARSQEWILPSSSPFFCFPHPGKRSPTLARKTFLTAELDQIATPIFGGH